MPWHEHKGEPRFICDVMTEGLAKQLRLYGVDAAAVQSKGKGSRHLVYRSASPLPFSLPLPSALPLPVALRLANALCPSIALPSLLSLALHALYLPLFFGPQYWCQPESHAQYCTACDSSCCSTSVLLRTTFCLSQAFLKHRCCLHLTCIDSAAHVSTTLVHSL